MLETRHVTTNKVRAIPFSKKELAAIVSGVVLNCISEENAAFTVDNLERTVL